MILENVAQRSKLSIHHLKILFDSLTQRQPHSHQLQAHTSLYSLQFHLMLITLQPIAELWLLLIYFET